MNRVLSSEGEVFDCGALLFDLDGTLVDSSGVVVRTWSWWAQQHGIELERILAVSHGRPSRDVIRELAPHLDHTREAQGILAREELDREGLVLIPDANRVIAEASAAGPWTVVTSCPINLARIRLEAVGIQVPPTMVTANQIKRGKPDPEAFLLGAERLGVAAQDCVVFEDAPAGIQAAKTAGMRVVAVEFHRLPVRLPQTDAIIPDYRGVKVTPRGAGLRVLVSPASTQPAS